MPSPLPKTIRQSYWQGSVLYPWSMVWHHVQGALAAFAILEAPLFSQLVGGVIWTVLYIAYQWLTQKRKHDAAGLDVLDYMVGFGLMWALIEAWRHVGALI